MLDLNRYYPPKYYIGDVYLEYLAEKKQQQQTGQRIIRASNEWKLSSPRLATFQNRQASKGSCYTFYVMIYNICIEKLSLSGNNLNLFMGYCVATAGLRPDKHLISQSSRKTLVYVVQGFSLIQIITPHDWLLRSSIKC